MVRWQMVAFGLLVLSLVRGVSLEQDKASSPAADKDPLPSAVDKAAFIAVARVQDAEQYRGMGGGIVGMYTVEIKRVLKGKEEARQIRFTLQLTSHDSQPKFSHPDPQKAKGDILVLLKGRRVAEGDVWYDLVSRENPTWWVVDSAEARRVEKLVAKKLE